MRYFWKILAFFGYRRSVVSGFPFQVRDGGKQLVGAVQVYEDRID